MPPSVHCALHLTPLPCCRHLPPTSAFSHEALARDLAVVVVGYPATPINSARARFCISASHTRADLDETLAKVSEIGDVMQLKFKRKGMLSGMWPF